MKRPSKYVPVMVVSSLDCLTCVQKHGNRKPDVFELPGSASRLNKIALLFPSQ